MLKRMLKRYSLALAVMLPVAAACSDENPTGPRAGALVGRWQITSLQVSGVELAEAGTSLEIMFTAAGTYAVITNDDGSGHCDATSCTETGTYEATSTHITMDPGSDEEIVFRYIIQGNTMTFTGNVEETPVRMVLQRL